MKKLLIVIDMQNDFVHGVLGTKEARAIVPTVCKKVKEYQQKGDLVLMTKDTHDHNFANTQESKGLPEHCKIGTPGHDIIVELAGVDCMMSNKCSFTSIEFAQEIMMLVKKESVQQIELCGLCTDVCVVSNALVIKAALPEMKVVVDQNACAGVTPQKHQAALDVLQSCQVVVV
ncbi:MAG: cysteine hydrolase [Firmicutes bacterium]|nr:cysteine hydrolase [Bacillota bacterium]